MLRMARVITSMNRRVGSAAAWLILPMFILLLADVIMRYAVGRPTAWTSELAQYLFGLYAVIGGGYLLTFRGHVNVDLLYSRFSRRRKALSDAATSFLFFLFVGVLFWQGASLAWDSIIRWETSYSSWNPPVWPAKLVIPVAALLLLLQGIVRLWADIRTLRGKAVDEDVFGKAAPDGDAQ